MPAFKLVDHISKISWRTYTQAFYFDTIAGRSLTFKSDPDAIGPAYDADGNKELVITGGSASYDVVVSAYFDITSAKLNAEDIRNPQYASSKFKLQTVWIFIYFTFVSYQCSSLLVVSSVAHRWRRGAGLYHVQSK